MESVFSRQLDYIFFFYGLSFFLVAQACFSARKGSGKGLPWIWLGLFGLAHGLNEILELFVLSFGDTDAFGIIRLVILAVSYLFLLEFARAGSAEEGGFEAKRWLFLPLVAAASLGANAGLAGLNVSVRYSFGLVGGLWASYAFFASSRNGGPGRGWLRALGIIMAFYAVFTGLVVPPASFIPASLVNTASFQSLFGFPVQLVRGMAGLFIAISLVVLNQVRPCSKEQEENASFSKPICSFRPLIIVMAILAMGWFVTNAVSDYGDSIAKKNLFARALTAAAVIYPGDVSGLTGSAGDQGTAVFEHIRTELQAIRASSSDCRSVRLLSMRGGRIIYLADARPKKSEDYSPPGRVYSDATQDIEDFRKAKAAVYKPYTDPSGTWVKSEAYIRDKSTGKFLARIEMETDAREWIRSVAIYRFFSIVIIFVLCALSMAFYIAWHRSRESSERGLALRLASHRLEDEKKLRAIMDALGLGVIMEENGRITFINPEAERLLGWKGDELEGEDLYKTLVCRDAEFRKVPPEELPSRKAAVSGRSVRAENLFFTKKGGEQFPVSCVCSPIVDVGRISGTVLTFQDISERKDLEKQKADFYAMVTHDLKSPLTIIQGYTDILLIERRQKLDPDTIMVVNSIWESCGRLLRLVNDFLTVSRLEFGKLSLNESFDSVSSLILDLEEEFSALARKKNISLAVNIQDGLPRTVFDRAHVHRAIHNLVDNAVVYSPSGGQVSVKAETHSEDGSEFIKVLVTDTGPGIPKEEADKIFEMYYRSKKTAGVKGSGLGLAITKGVAVAHGGRVGLVSSGSSGSIFEFLLPVKKI